jgi:hypothetical protein
MAKTLIQATLYRPAPNDDVTANGYIEARPSLRRDIDGIDGTVLPARTTARLGAALTYTDNSDVEQTAPATPGVAWFFLDATDAGDAANLWYWTFTERTDGGTRRYCTVPTSAVTVDYRDLPDIDPATYDPDPATPLPGWSVALAAAVADLEAEIAAVESGDVDSVAGETGTVTAAALKTALALPADTEAELAVQLAAINAEIVVREAEDLALQVDIETKLAAASNLADLPDAAEARTNLGLGTAATADATDFATPDLGSRLAYAVNETGVPTGYSSTAADLSYLTIVVPPSPDRDVWIEWGTTFYATTIAHGTLKSMLYEVTSAETFRDYQASDVSANGFASADPHSSHRGSYLIGRTTTYRTFIVKLITTKKTGVTYPAGGVFNGYQGLNPKSWIGAFAR